MSFKFNSLVKILNMLDQGKQVTLDSVANHFGVTKKTAERYMGSLKTSFPAVAYDRKQRSYVFEQGFKLKRIDLSTEEQLFLGLAKEMLQKFGGQSGRIIESIEKKLGAYGMPFPKHIVFSGDALPPQVEEYILRLDHAIREQQVVEINYRATYKSDEISRRTVEPYFLFFESNLWYLRAYCRLRKELRVFALDKIDSLSILDKHFLPKISVVPEEELLTGAHAVLDGSPVTVTLRFDAKIAPAIKRRKWFMSQKEKILPDNMLQMTCQVNGFVGIKHWIMRWIPYVEVVGPKELKNLIIKEMQEALRINL